MICKYILSFSIVYLCIAQSRAAELTNNALLFVPDDNSCYFEHYGKPLSEAQWIEGVDISSSILDVERSFTMLYSATSRNIRSIDGIKINGRYGPGNKGRYVDIFLVRHYNDKDLELVMVLNTDFENYEEYETSDVMKVEVTFLCANGRNKSLEIRQKIIDTNNHDPAFCIYNSNYLFNLPNSLNPYHFIGKITVRDIDLTNNYIDFNFRSTGNNTYREYALLGAYRNQSDPKQFHAWFVTTEQVSLNHHRRINIFAQDSGKPSRNAEATVYLYPQNTSSNN